MDHAPSMGVGHGLTDLLEDREEAHPVLIGTPARREQRRQGTAPDQLHRDEQPAIGEAPQLVDGDDPGVLELAADLGLLHEAADHLGVIAVLLPDHLDGEIPAQVEVASLEDRAHPAPGQFADQLVTRGLARELGASRVTWAGSGECPRMCLGDELAGLPRSLRPDSEHLSAARLGPIFSSKSSWSRFAPGFPRPASGSTARATPRRNRQRGQRPAGENAGRRAEQSGQISTENIPGSIDSVRSDKGPCSWLGESRRRLQSRGGIQPSRAAKSVRISSST